MIDLRVMGEKRDLELKRLSEDALAWVKHAQKIQSELSVIQHTNQRKMVSYSYPLLVKQATRPVLKRQTAK